MNILITGAKGFIGKHLVKRLSKKHNVTEHEWGDQLPDLWHYKAVIHTGAISSTTYTDVEQILKQNYEFTIDLIQKATEVGCMIQYSSSASVYGPTDHFTEDGPLLPQSPYAWSKFLVDRWVSSHFFASPVQGFRYFNVYGKGEEHKGDMMSPVSKFTKQAKETGIIKIFKGSENYLRDFICVKDVCAIHEIMLEHRVKGIFNVGTGEATSFKTIAELIATKYNANIEEIDMPIEIRQQYQEFTKANLNSLRKHTDYKFMQPKTWINQTKG